VAYVIAFIDDKVKEPGPGLTGRPHAEVVREVIPDHFFGQILP
jgi:hypothetical protein